MKIKLLLITALTGTLATTSVLAIPTITINRTLGCYRGDGGEFAVKVNQDISYASYGGTVAPAGSSFETFCLEKADYISVGSTYTAYVDNKISGNNGNTTLSLGAAYLYDQFLAGTLNGYNYTVGSGRAASAGLLQQTIWWTMGQYSNPGGAFVADLAGAGINATAAISGAYYLGTKYDVAVLNLGQNGDGSAQAQLIAWTRGVQPHGNGSPVPDGGSTVMMLGAALSGLGLVIRRLKHEL